MTNRHWFLWIILAVLIGAIQFVPVELPQNNPDRSADLLRNTTLPEDVSKLLVQGCYDCHSQQIQYPWYAYIAPVSWLVARDIKAGMEELNFSQWANLNTRKKIGALSDIAEQIEQKEMPLHIYTFMHPEARFSAEERARIIEWAEATASGILGD